MTKEFSEKTLKKFNELIKRYPTKQSVLLPALRLAEEEFGCIDEEVMKYIAQLVEVPPAKVLGVFSFYTHYRRKGTGKYLIQVCSTLPCALRNSEEIFKHIKNRLGIDIDETTRDGLFTLKKVECLGSCGSAPVVQINDNYYENLTIEKIDEILDKLSKERQ